MLTEKKSYMKKTFTPLFFKVVIIMGLFFAQTHTTDAQTITENFDNTSTWISTSTFSTSTVQIGTSTQSTWIYSGGQAQSTSFNSTGRAFNLTNSGSAYLITPIITGGVSTVTVAYRNSSNNAAMGIGVATNTTFVTGSATQARSSTLTTGASPWVVTSQYTNGASSVTVWSTWTFDVANALGANSTKDMYFKFFRVSGTVFIDDIVITIACSNPVFSTQPSTSAQTVCQGGDYHRPHCCCITSGKLSMVLKCCEFKFRRNFNSRCY